MLFNLSYWSLHLPVVHLMKTYSLQNAFKESRSSIETLKMMKFKKNQIDFNDTIQQKTGKYSTWWFKNSILLSSLLFRPTINSRSSTVPLFSGIDFYLPIEFLGFGSRRTTHELFAIARGLHEINYPLWKEKLCRNN